MVYTEQVWHDEPAADTPLSAARLTHLEAGVKEASDRATVLEARPIVNSPDDIGAQPVDSDLTAIAALAPLDDAVIQRKAGAWTSRTPAQLKSDLGVTKADVGLSNADNTSDAAKPVSTAQQTALNLKATLSALATVATSGVYADLTGKPTIPDSPDDIGAQPLDTDLSVFAALAPTNDDIVQRKAGAWANRTVAQVKADFGLAAVATSGAYADLTGTVPTSALPALAINDVFTVGSQAAMLALTAQRGDVAIRTDAAATFILSSDSPTTLADWKVLPTPTDAVLSVNGQSGVVSLAKGDIGLGAVDNTSDAAKPVSTAQQTALDGKQSLDSDLTAIAAIAPANDDVVQRKAGVWTNRTMAQVKTDLVLARADVGLSNVDNTSDANKPVSTATQTALNGKQPLDTDLTVIAALTPTDGDLLQRVAGAWANRTVAQVRTDLGLATVATSGSYTDLSSRPVATASRPVFPLANYSSGWHSASVGIDDCRDNGGIAEVWIVRITVPAGEPVNQIGTLLKTAGTVGAGGENGFAIYADDGSVEYFRVDDDNLWTTAGVRNVSLGGSSIAAQATDKTYRVAVNVRGFSAAPDFLFVALPVPTVEGASKRCRYGPSAFPAAPFDPVAFGGSTGGYMPFVALGR